MIKYLFDRHAQHILDGNRLLISDLVAGLTTIQKDSKLIFQQPQYDQSKGRYEIGHYDKSLIYAQVQKYNILLHSSNVTSIMYWISYNNNYGQSGAPTIMEYNNLRKCKEYIVRTEDTFEGIYDQVVKLMKKYEKSQKFYDKSSKRERELRELELKEILKKHDTTTRTRNGS